METHNIDNKYLSPEEFERIAVPCDVIEKVTREIADSELPFPAGHESYLKRARAWSVLNNQVVGAETDLSRY